VASVLPLLESVKLKVSVEDGTGDHLRRIGPQRQRATPALRTLCSR
jgi:hypothetical protein